MSRLSLRSPGLPATEPRQPWLGRLRHRALSQPARIALVVLGWLVAATALFTCYLHLSRTVPANSDGASVALAAWSMLHGNLLLHGWVLADVSFYTTEVPQYLVIEFFHGLTPDDMHIAGALTYTLLVVLVTWVAKGGAHGAEGWTRVLVAAAIMIAPPVGSVYVLMLEPDHLGSTVPVLLLVLALDRIGTGLWARPWNPRSWQWAVPLLALLLVIWAVMADQVILITMVGPLIFVAVVHGYRRLVVVRRQAWTAWPETALAAAAVLGTFVARRLVALVSASGGYKVFPVNQQLARFDTLPHNLQETIQGILVLFGANFTGHRAGVLSGIGLLHLVSIGIVLWALGVTFRHLWRFRISVQLLAASVSFTLLAYLLGPNALDAQSSREMAAVLPLGAALAGRVLARRFRRAKLVPAVAAVLAIYLGGLAFYATRPAVPADNQALASWLVSHRMRYGLTPDYWLANSTTVDSGGKVAVRAVHVVGDGLQLDPWEINRRWYRPANNVATFAVLPGSDSSSGPASWRKSADGGAFVHTFGQPVRVYVLPGYTVLVWHGNLLTGVG